PTCRASIWSDRIQSESSHRIHHEESTASRFDFPTKARAVCSRRVRGHRTTWAWPSFRCRQQKLADLQTGGGDSATSRNHITVRGGFDKTLRSGRWGGAIRPRRARRGRRVQEFPRKVVSQLHKRGPNAELQPGVWRSSSS